jgi:hypothetical protein
MTTFSSHSHLAARTRASRGYMYADARGLNSGVWHYFSPEKRPAMAGTKVPNEPGIQDWSGKVRERCRDEAIQENGNRIA